MGFVSEVEERRSVRVELFGSVFCPYCAQAKRFFDEKGIPYEYREVPMVLGIKLPLKAYREMKTRSGGQKTVPQIFIDGEYYGDEERLFADDREGKLDRLSVAEAEDESATAR